MPRSLNTLNLKQLTELVARAEKRIEMLKADKAAKVRDRLARFAKAEGYSLNDLFGAPRRRGRKTSRATTASTGKAKFRDPSNPAQTWTGHGRRPRWYLAALKSGKKPQDLQVR